MKILSLDTSSDICCVSILEDEKEIAKLQLDKGKTHSENLMPLISSILKNNNLTLSQMNLFVCDKGPGSFTGIRIGIATIKAFTDSLNIPSIGVNSLEVLASSITSNGLVASIIDAKNENCYFALYDKKNEDLFEQISPKACTIYEAIDNIKNYLKSQKDIFLIGNGSINYQSILTENLEFDKLNFSDNNDLNSFYVGLCGYKKFKNGIFEEVLPLYLKKPHIS